MTPITLILRSLRYFRASHAALLAGMMLVTAVLTGALILGDSVRDSLGDLTRRRRGAFETVVTAPGFFSESLAARAGQISHRFCAAGLALSGRTASQRTGLSSGAQLLAIPAVAAVPHQGAWITRALAESLQVSTGDALLVTLPGGTGAFDAVLQRRDRASVLSSLRVTIERILNDRTMQPSEAFAAWFDLHPSQRAPISVWLNLADVQAALWADVPAVDRVPELSANVLLAGPNRKGIAIGSEVPSSRAMTLADYGLSLSRAGDEITLRSGRIFISPPIATALHPLRAVGQAVYTLLLDRVTAGSAPGKQLSYVIATGISGHDDLRLADDEAAVNQWTADQLRLKVGDKLYVTPYRLKGDGTVAAAESEPLTLARIVPMSGLGADATLTPMFHGLTDADTIARWNPPAGFPFDRARVTAADEAYWRRYKAAPKVFFNLATAQRLMTTQTLGANTPAEITSMRFSARRTRDLDHRVLGALAPELAGMTARPFAPDQPGGTDFASLFLALSAFLLIAALLLVVLLFRLAVEQRSRQLGLLGAVGFTPGRIGRLILAEGALVATLGTLAGLIPAVLYTRLLVNGLGTWWIGATGTQAIRLHVHFQTLIIGTGASLVAALLALGVTAWRQTRLTPISRLQGLEPTRSMGGPRGGMAAVGVGLAGLAVAVTPVALSWAGKLDAPVAFLLTGFLLLALAMAVLARLPTGTRRVRRLLPGVAAAGIFRQRTRAILCVSLMAAAVFLVASVTAFESSPAEASKPPSPTGGYQLIIETRIPLPADLQTAAGRRLLGVPENPVFASARFTAMPVKPGDDISCLNMTRPASATLVGIPRAVLDRFVIVQTGPLMPEGEAIPAAVDQQTAQYILHARLGDRLASSATTRTIVLNALLADSIFQNCALIPESDFHSAFPDVKGCSLILVDCPPSSVSELRQILRRHLDDFGVTVETTAQRLAAYHAVADSYIAAFQFLGALALVVGALGLVVVLARNVIQRRAELALLEAIGFTRGRVTLMLAIEHGLLLLLGLCLGVAAALVATAPQMRQMRLLPVGAAAIGILGTGLAVLIVAARAATGRLTPADLRQE